MKSFRKLKIHSKIHERAWNKITVPEIRLEGKWLKELGFKEGGKVKVELRNNRLTITPDVSAA